MLRGEIPERDVGQMDAPVGDEAAAVIPPSPPPEPASLERMPPGGTFKHLPVQSLGDRYDRLRRSAVPRAGELDDGVRHLPQLPILHDLGGLLEMRPRPLLPPELDDPIR